MTAPPPPRSDAQRRAALAAANHVRETRARLKIDLKARRLDWRAVLEEPPAELRSMPVRGLLLTLPGMGPVKSDEALRRARISPAKTVAGLTRRQRDELATVLLLTGPPGLNRQPEGPPA